MKCEYCGKKVKLFSMYLGDGGIFCSGLCDLKSTREIRKKMQEKIDALKAGKKILKETRCTCNSCGKVWHYDKQDKIEATTSKMKNFGKGLMIVGGFFPALLIPDKKTKGLNRCPECNSQNVKCEEVTHLVERS